MTKGPFRIAHVLFGRPGPDTLEGLGKSVFHLARSQSAQGADVAVFCLAHGPTGAIARIKTNLDAAANQATEEYLLIEADNFSACRQKKIGPAALILPSPRGAPQRTRSRLDLAKGSMGAKAIVEHGNSSLGPPDSVI